MIEKPERGIHAKFPRSSRVSVCPVVKLYFANYFAIDLRCSRVIDKTTELLFRRSYWSFWYWYAYHNDSLWLRSLPIPITGAKTVALPSLGIRTNDNLYSQLTVRRPHSPRCAELNRAKLAVKKRSFNALYHSNNIKESWEAEIKRAK